jgi:hypothetical protein
VILRERSPFATGRCHVGDVSHLAGEIAGERVHVVGEILPRSCDARHTRLPAQLSFSSHFARHASYFGRECAELIDHDVDRVLELENFSLCVSGDLPAQVAFGYCGRHVGDISHLTCEVRRHEVHVVGEVLPRARDVRHFGLTAEFSLGSYFLRNACYFAGKNSERVHHRVDRLLELENLSLHVDRDLS